jgi:hypothetical protein
MSFPVWKKRGFDKSALSKRLKKHQNGTAEKDMATPLRE